MFGIFRIKLPNILSKRAKQGASFAAVMAVSLAGGAATAGEADVVGAVARLQSDNVYAFDVTLRHADTGWEHYADRWDVVGPNGDILGSRILYHPHVDEQPFTRSLSNVKVPEGTTSVTIQAHDSTHGLGGKTMTIQLPQQ